MNEIMVNVASLVASCSPDQRHSTGHQSDISLWYLSHGPERLALAYDSGSGDAMFGSEQEVEEWYDGIVDDVADMLDVDPDELLIAD